MEFGDNKPIYRHIFDLIAARIIDGTWSENCRVPSVREEAVELQVNPNTVMRAFELLQTSELIYNRRGIGYFVAEGARDKALQLAREEFTGETLPAIFERMEQLGLTIGDITKLYEQYKTTKR